jgi:hypothetical protein
LRYKACGIPLGDTVALFLPRLEHVFLYPFTGGLKQR